jgi:hypothetical protein
MQGLAATIAIAATLAACGERDEPEIADSGIPDTTLPTTTTTTPADLPPPQGQPTKPAEAPPGDPRPTALERAAARTVRDYVQGLNARDGEAVCDLFAPGALSRLELPEARGSCGASVSASIGYRDPRGLPVWERSRIQHLRVAELKEDAAKVIATVKTEFADRDEISTEDDVVYLVRDRKWLLAKPSATLYRAVGIAQIPVSVLAPPPG